jgi:hypothetical protein
MLQLSVENLRLKRFEMLSAMLQQLVGALPLIPHLLVRWVVSNLWLKMVV